MWGVIVEAVGGLLAGALVSALGVGGLGAGEIESEDGVEAEEQGRSTRSK
jgi:hypothetical protein